MTESIRPNVDAVLGQLKNFQRDTVEYVHQRLWLDADPARRFLVADEVGLGKTMVARGVIARTLDHLWDEPDLDRLDIVYICSNSQIARQNIGRLGIEGDDLNHADRLTLLGKQIASLRERRVNVVSFTPGTSFSIGESSGRVEERALIFALLRKAWGRAAVASAAWERFFMDAASAESFQRAVSRISKEQVDDGIAAALVEELHESTYGDTGNSLHDALLECVSGFRYLREGSTAHEEVRRARARIIGRMRAAIAGAALKSLRPTLVILDEFQRFKALLDENDPTAQLAHALFAAGNTRVLMLSATPYKMYTLPDEPEGENHYEDFEATIRFLAGQDTATAVGKDLALMRRGILEPTSRETAEQARNHVQVALRRCMSRTERLANTPDRDGMLQERPARATLAASDVLAYRTGQGVADAIAAASPSNGDGRSSDILEYWRSTPYLLNLMDDYKLKRDFTDTLTSNNSALASALQNGHGLLNWSSIETYQRVDPGNAKMRSLTADVIDRGAWKLAWLPPSLPYYTLGGDYAREELASFTKRLIFSAWNVVPKAIATLVSYDAERAAAVRVDSERRHGTPARPLLNFSRSEGRLSGMPLLALLYPSVTLAELGDPIDLARRMGEIPAPRARMESMLRDRVEAALERLPAGPADGPVDQSWYWAAPFLLDRANANQQDFLDEMLSWGNSGDDDAPESTSAQQDHIAEAARFDASTLGRRPQDLTQVVGLMALAGPGNVAVRALRRASPDLDLDDVDLRSHATTVSWALRRVFNQQQVTDIVRYGSRDEVYWRAVLNHCFDGCLQSVLDEWVHILTESEGLGNADAVARAARLAEVIEESMLLRRSTNQLDDYRVVDGRVVTAEPRRTLGAHFAVRFGRDSSDTEKSQDRERAVRASFNSPFWPFVLASTSVGQEGLDFHLYSHAVVHWNLPSNPVDLEQREGRVHRYKNHAVRKNVAKAYGRAVLDSDDSDPWAALFQAAVDDRPEGASDLVPFWIFAPEGGAVIERYVPALPLSQEMARYHRLQRTVGAYRMTFGQPRQEDLLAYAAGAADDLGWLAIDLSPH